MHRLSLLTVFIGCFSFAACSPPGPSSAADKIEEHYLESTEGLESFAVLSDEVTVYHQLSASDSLRLFQPIAVSNQAPDKPMIDPFRLPAVQRLAIGLREGGSLDSTFTLEDDSEVIAYSIKDPTVMLAPNAPQAPNDVTKLQVLVDASTFDIRGINGTFQVEGLEEPVREYISYNNYAEFDDIRLPSQTVVRVEGLDQMFTDEQKMIMRGQIGAEREKARLFPPTEGREQFLEQIRQQEMLLEEGAQETRFDVEDVRVGEPIPDNLQQLLQGTPAASPAPTDSTETEPAAS